MRGEILSFDEFSGNGLISGDDGARYGFDRAEIQAGSLVRPGARVDFVPQGGQATQVMVLTGAALAQEPATAAPSLDWKTLFTSFKGRLRRSHFWIGWAILFVLGLIFSFFPSISFFVGLILLVGHLAIGFKRFHDIGKPGWLVVIPWAIWYAAYGLLIASFGVAVLFDSSVLSTMAPETMLATGGAAFGAIALASLISLGFWLWLGIADSQKGPNAHGPNPKGE